MLRLTVIRLLFAMHLWVVCNYLLFFRQFLGQDGPNIDFANVDVQDEWLTMVGVRQNRGSGKSFLELLKISSTLR